MECIRLLSLFRALERVSGSVPGRQGGVQTKTLKCIDLVFIALLALIGSGVLARASITPVVRPDPRGSELEPLCDGPARDKFDRAIAYLKQVPQAAEIIERLENSSADYRVEILARGHPSTCAGPDHFDEVSNLIQWDPHLGFRWHGTFYSYHARSPALSLMHEFAHAYHKEVDSDRFFRLLFQPTADPRWSNLEEKRTILEVENPVAAALGESERYFHADLGFFRSDLYTVVDPTSTAPAPQHVQFMPVAKEKAPGGRQVLKEALHRALEESRRAG